MEDQRDSAAARCDAAVTAGHNAARDLTIRVAADLRAPLRQAASRGGWTFADEVHRRLEASLHLHVGDRMQVNGSWVPMRKRWHPRADSRGIVRLRCSVAQLLAETADAAGWAIASEVNERLAASLFADAEKAIGANGQAVMVARGTINK